MISEGLADYYKMSVKDTLVLLGQGYHGMSAAGKYAVKGIIKFRNPTLNQNTVIMSIPQAQWFFSTGNQVTSLILEKEEFTKVETLVADVSKKIDLNTFEVFEADAIVVALPAPQAYAVLENSQDETPVRRVLADIDIILYDATYTLTAVYPNRSLNDWAVLEVGGQDVALIVNESVKTESKGTITGVCTPK